MRPLNQFTLFPPVIKGLLLINAGVFVLQLALAVFTFGGVSLNEIFQQYFALMPFDLKESLFMVKADYYVFYPWQLITYQFLHGGFFHIFFNLFMLWMFGVELENEWGSGKFLAYYLLAGIGAGLAHLIIGPLFGQIGPTVGASGSIYGILLAFALSHPDRQIYMFPFFIPIKSKYFILILIGFDLFAGLWSPGSGVAHFAHLGGAATGYILMKLGDDLAIYRFTDKFFQTRRTGYGRQDSFGTRSSTGGGGKVFTVSWTKPPEQKIEEKRYDESPHSGQRAFEIDGEKITQSRIDEILDKISESGYQNLSDREKHILTELSKKI